MAGYESILGLANEDGSLAFQDTSKVIYTTIDYLTQSLADFCSLSVEAGSVADPDPHGSASFWEAGSGSASKWKAGYGSASKWKAGSGSASSKKVEA